ERLAHELRQLLDVAERVEADAVVEDLPALLDQELAEELHQPRDLVGRARPVLGRKRVEGQRLDPELAGGAGDIAAAARALAVPFDTGPVPQLRRAAVTIHDDADVTRQTAGCHRCGCPIDLVGSMKAMGIFSRLGTLIKSNINDLITKAEDPEKMLSQ